jgi:glycosyltransferase involved in cell wall biosynthesis
MTLVIIDGRLRDHLGHHSQLAGALAQEQAARGGQTAIWCDAAVESDVAAFLAQCGAKVTAGLTVRRADALRVRAVMWAAAASMYVASLRRIAAAHGRSANVFFPSGEIDVLLGVATALELGIIESATVQIFYWNRRIVDATTSPASELLLRLAGAMVRRLPPERLRLVAHSESLAEALAAKLGRPVSAIPLSVHWSSLPEITSRSETARVRVGVLGTLREDKGASQIVEAIRKVRADVQWVVQASPGTAVAASVRNELIAEVRERQGELHIDDLGAEAYGALMASCDVVILPYHPLGYRERTSGVVVEAMGCAVIPIAPVGTWLATEMARYGVGLAYEPWTSAALAAAIDQVVANRAGLTRASLAAADAVRRENTAGRVLDVLTQVATKNAARRR